MQVRTSTPAPCGCIDLGMGRVLIVWELGAHLGHVLRILGVARELRARGVELLIAVRDLRASAATLGREGFACVQAPMVPALPSGTSAPPEPAGYAGILAGCGFGDNAMLRAMVQGWDGLLDVYRPHALLADHAPTALLAARLRKLPAAQIALGFELPPTTRPLPVLRPWISHDAGELLALEDSLLATINTLCDERGGTRLDHLAQLYASAAPMLATLPELDHFAGREGGDYVGPLYSLDEGEAAEWPAADAPGPKAFVYLRPGPSARHVLEALSRRAAGQTIAAIPGLDDATAVQFRSTRMAVHRHAVRTRIALSADLLVSNGGHGLTAAALLAGVPLLALPGNVEQWMLAQRVVQLGAGISLNPDQVAQRAATVIDTLLTGGAERTAAQTFAARHADVDQAGTTRRIVDAVEQLCTAKDEQSHQPAHARLVS